MKGMRLWGNGLGISALIWLNACLYTTHHFNTGKTLERGMTNATIGMGSHRFSGRDMLKFSLNYQLGICGNLGMFPGADIGWHLEMPTNPGTMEFNIRLAMPVLRPDNFHHSMSAGWGIGMWADNTFFAEYAASFRLRQLFTFANLRGSYLATQFFKVFQSDMEHPLTHNQKWVWQAGFGFKADLPNLPIVPDFIIPQCIITYPNLPAGKSDRDIIRAPQWNFNIGTGWRF